MMTKRWMGALGASLLWSLASGCNADLPPDELPNEAAASGVAQQALIVGVDPYLKPRTSQLPPGDDQKPRPVVALLDEKGTQVDFAEGELLITSSDYAAVKDFAAQYGGQITLVIEPPSKLPEQPEPGAPLPRTNYLVRIDPAKVDVSLAKLEDALRVINKTPDYKLNFGVSTQAGLATLALAADAKVNKQMEVGLNLVGLGDTLASGSTVEASSGPGGYTPNAFSWSHLNGGLGPLAASGLNTGTAQAWRMMTLANRSFRPTIGVLDQGFAPDADFPSGFTSFSNIPFRPALNQRNLGGCGGPCPWHGTGVVHTAAGVADNGTSAAGSAGTFANVVVGSTSYDYATGILAITGAVGRGARIINMSFGARIPWPLAWTALPFQWTTSSLRAGGILFFASAGNDSVDVDSSCGIWGECEWVIPCEADGVICVGATPGSGTPMRAGYSNFGTGPLASTGDVMTAQTVDLWAPGTVFVGANPDTTPGVALSFSGTSAASPYAAGVAALVWSSRPDFRANDVQATLMRTATSPDGTVRRFLNSYNAVLAALGFGHTTANSCSHPVCTTGGALSSGCDMPIRAPAGIAVPVSANDCVARVCAADPYCCNNAWDSLCKGAVPSTCGLQCFN